MSKSAATIAATLAIASCSQAGIGDRYTRQAAESLDGVRPFELRMSYVRGFVACATAPDSARDIPGVRCLSRLSPSTLSRASHVATPIRDPRDSLQAFDHARALAIIDLVLREDDDVGKTIATLETLARQARGDPLILNDLAIAYGVRSANRQTPSDLARSLDVLERAVVMDSANSILAFNRALVLDRLNLLDEARRAWSRFLSLDSQSAWSVEARRYIGRLDSAMARARSSKTLCTRAVAARTGAEERVIASERPGDARACVTDSLLPAWAKWTASGDRAAATVALERARWLAAGLLAASGDSTAIDAVQSIAVLGRASTARVAAAVTTYGTAQHDYAAGNFVAALARMDSALGRLPHGGVIEGLALVTKAGVAGEAGRVQEALRILESLRDRLHQRPFHSLSGSAEWMRSLTLARAGRLDEALAAGRQATALLRQLGESEHLGGALVVTANIGHLVGLLEEGNRDLYRASLALRGQTTSTYYHGLLSLVEYFDTDAGLGAAAVAAYREDVAISSHTGRTKDAPEVRIRLAQAEAAAGFGAAARTEVETSRRLLGSVEDTVTRQRLEVDLSQVEATLAEQEQPALALRLLDQSTRFFDGRKAVINLIPTLTARARVRSRTGDANGARQDLVAAAALLSAELAGKPNPILRRTLAARVTDVRNGLIRASLERGDAREALTWAVWRPERRSFHAAASGRLPTVPEGRRVIVYAVLPDRIIVWGLDEPGLTVRTVNVSSQSLQLLVDQFRLAIEAGDRDQYASTGNKLRAILLDPMTGNAGAIREVTIIPDGPLARLPFAALPVGDGRYLVEIAPIRFAVDLDAIGRPFDGMIDRARDMRPLIVGNPAFDRTAFPDLPPLRTAEDEARTVARLYRQSDLLLGGAATREAIVSKLGRHGIFHFAGHARGRDEDPASAHLLVAADRMSSGLLSGAAIAEMNLSRVELVILSACGSLSPDAGSYTGLGGIAEAFLAAGARATIGTSWAADDEGTARMMERFHRSLLTTDPASALRAAQMAMVNGAEERYRAPRYWAGFIYISR